MVGRQVRWVLCRSVSQIFRGPTGFAYELRQLNQQAAGSFEWIVLLREGVDEFV
jgi:hypothetical protein